MSRTTASIHAPRRSAGQTPPESRWTLCPRSSCQTPLKPQPLRGHDPRTGLESIRCPACGHQGYVARQGVQLLFSDRRESVFTYGPSLSTLTSASVLVGPDSICTISVVIRRIGDPCRGMGPAHWLCGGDGRTLPGLGGPRGLL